MFKTSCYKWGGHQKQLRSLTDPGDTRRNLNINLWTPNCDQKLQLQLNNCSKKLELDTLLIAKKNVKIILY